MVISKMLNITIGAILTMVGILIGFVVIPPVIIALFPTAVTGLVTLSTLGNFTFAGLFTSSGMFMLLLSLVGFLLMLGVVIAGVMYVLSMTGAGKGKR